MKFIASIFVLLIFTTHVNAQWKSLSVISTAGNEYTSTSGKSMSYVIGQFAVFPVIKSDRTQVVSNFLLQDTQIETLIKKELPAEQFRINVYPNPTTTYINVDIFAENFSEANKFTIQVFDILGRSLSAKLNISNKVFEANQTITLDTNDLTDGQYFIKIVSHRNFKPIASFKFLKQN